MVPVSIRAQISIFCQMISPLDRRTPPGVDFRVILIWRCFIANIFGTVLILVISMLPLTILNTVQRALVFSCVGASVHALLIFFPYPMIPSLFSTIAKDRYLTEQRDVYALLEMKCGLISHEETAKTAVKCKQIRFNSTTFVH